MSKTQFARGFQNSSQNSLYADDNTWKNVVILDKISEANWFLEINGLDKKNVLQNWPFNE